MSMTPETQQQLTRERFARWTTELAALGATPFILVGVSHTDHRLQVFVPHRDAPEQALMVEALRRAADDLEAQAPQPWTPEGPGR